MFGGGGVDSLEVGWGDGTEFGFQLAREASACAFEFAFVADAKQGVDGFLHVAGHDVLQLRVLFPDFGFEVVEGIGTHLEAVTPTSMTTGCDSQDGC